MGSATEHTRRRHREHARVIAAAESSSHDDLAEAARGFIATTPDGVIRDENGTLVRDTNEEVFLADDAAPDTVHPSLWRQARLNRHHGLFLVADGVYQVRGYDVSNLTIIEGETGVVLIDPLMSVEASRAALALYRQERGERAVRAVVFTHSHGDHFGGVRGVVDERQASDGAVPIVAPAGFLSEATSENVYAGTAMRRRSMYQFGVALPFGPLGAVDSGIGRMNRPGTTSLLAPTVGIAESGKRLVLDGVEFVFVLAPGTEAPAEMLVWLPATRVLNTAEIVTRTMHNLHAPRGAQVRDARAWWRAIDDVLEQFRDDVEVLIAQHQWPVWGRERVIEVLEDQRDLYKFIHDRSLHLANRGLTSSEIAETIALPPALALPWHNHGYYGSLRHNAQAVYQRYLGWYDSNPARLDPLPPVDAARRYVDYMGGADAVVAKARDSFDAGDYRWVAEVLDRVVFAEPEHAAARALAADALEQLGFQSENAVWRSEYLTGAHELRNGWTAQGNAGLGQGDVVLAMDVEMLFDYLGILLDAPRAGGEEIAIQWVFPDLQRRYLVRLRRGVFVYTRHDGATGSARLAADAVVTSSGPALAALVSDPGSVAAALAEGVVEVDGDAGALLRLFGLFSAFDASFAIVEP